MIPYDAINRSSPNVWLTSTYGFDPHEWGLLGFSKDYDRKAFIDKTEPGVLVVIFGGQKCGVKERKKILGIMRCSHEIGPTENYMPSHIWQRKQQNPDEENRWNYAVAVTNAWHIAAEHRCAVGDFATESYDPAKGRNVGRRGIRLSTNEAKKILELDLEEANVFGQGELVGSAVAKATQIFTPSRAGPISQSPFVVREAEGPKHLYILNLKGDVSNFLGQYEKGKLQIVKVGLSRSPESRCRALNSAFPSGAYCWQVKYSTAVNGGSPYPNSKTAIAGEDEMKLILDRNGRSLGGEFFLADPSLIADAWLKGNEAAKAYSV